jgi:hypothetical protein
VFAGLTVVVSVTGTVEYHNLASPLAQPTTLSPFACFALAEYLVPFVSVDTATVTLLEAEKLVVPRAVDPVNDWLVANAVETEATEQRTTINATLIRFLLFMGTISF